MVFISNEYTIFNLTSPRTANHFTHQCTRGEEVFSTWCRSRHNPDVFHSKASYGWTRTTTQKSKYSVRMSIFVVLMDYGEDF